MDQAQPTLVNPTLSDAFALIGYNGTGNIGDEIQSLASRQFLPRVDFTVDREFLNLFEIPDGRRAKMILHGWFCHRPENWPPSESIIPLITSFHLSPGKPTELILREPVSRYLKAFGPVGARDIPTLEALQNAGVESFFSGCMTLTHKRRPVKKEEDLLVVNEVPDDVLNIIKQKTKKRIIWTSHIGFNAESQYKRFQIAEDLLSLYSKASAIVTTRLHCALPSLAMGTPVLLLDTAKDQWRFDGLNDFVHHCSPDVYVKNIDCYNVEEPPPNPNKHLPYRESLERRAVEFIGKAMDEIPYYYPLTWQERYHILRNVHVNAIHETRALRKLLEKKET